jgi:secondary thiamine-phosphate synthase enzyme
MPIHFTELPLQTHKRIEFVDITQKIQNFIDSKETNEGVCHVFVPHTTAAVTINENADPHVVRDIIYKLGELVPEKSGYQHIEGNSDAHIKASLLGAWEIITIKNRKLVLGRWQGIYFCEFDGPRHRKFYLTIYI